nr:TonB-dependent siderophore receptor [Propionivibrio soli]
MTPGEAVPSERTRSYTVERSASATRLNLSPRETPQSVSVVTREQIEDFKLNTINDVLDNTPGIVVEKVETDRTYYTSRGFDINNFQVDGIGVPLTYGNISGQIDTAIYDRIEVVRGANGLSSGTGNPSATINFIRKRPTADFQASAGLTLGSWDYRRLDADVSGPLNAAGTLRGRVVAAGLDKDSYLDRYEQKKSLFYGILEADLSDATLLTFGHTLEDGRSKNPMWGALPMYYTDGTPTHYDVSTNPAADWSYWNVKTQSTFAELAHRFTNDWQVKGTLTHNRTDSDSKLFYVYGTPDRATGLGLFAYPSEYAGVTRQDIADINATGPFTLAGRKHELVVGASWARSTLEDESNYGRGIGTPIQDLATWTGNYPEPAFDASVDGSQFTEYRRSAYAAVRINPTDAVKLVFGANATAVEERGTSYGVSRRKSESAVSPYAGVIYDFTPNLSAYASYTDIFNPQHEIDINRQTLAPIKGNNKEVGLKGEFFDKRLNASLAVFRTKQDNVAEAAGYLGTDTYYRGVDALSQGYELELAGNITSRLQATAGYTQLSIEDKDGHDVRTFTPRRLLRVTTTYRVPTIERLKVGASLQWRDSTYREPAADVTIRQSAYTLVNLMARYDFTDKVSATLNINNVTDRKYLTSLYWDQAYYGAPRHALLSLNVKY